MPAERGCALYRHFDAEGALLYVGISFNALSRLAQHRDVSGWFASIRRVDIEQFATRQDALAAERTAISTENPRHNIKRPRAEPPDEPQGTLETAGIQITYRVAELRPVYLLRDAADVLNISPSAALSLIEGGRLGHVLLPPHREGLTRHGNPFQPRMAVTGWQIIDYLESISA